MSAPHRTAHRASRRGYLLPAAGAALLLGAALTGCAHSGPSPARPAPSAPRVTSSAPATSPSGLTTGPVMVSSPPTSVTIPKLKVTSSLVPLGTQSDGAMEVPANADAVGWFTGAPTPGALGPAVLAGHVDWHGKKGAFANLSQLAAGDEVRVTRQDGSTAVFAVRSVNRYPKDKFPTDAVYGAIANAGLRLITCGGEFDSNTHHYLDNVVVFADLR
jgi:sortase (surface protein transpeptidase)